LNSKPLVYGLDRPAGPLQVEFDLPSRCAMRLHAGEVDIGLVPSIEYFVRAGYAIVPGVAVASDGPVVSVALFSREPIERVRRIALDTSSRTSAALLRVLCAERFGIRPEFRPADPHLPSMVTECDAALLIGDPALFADHEALGLLKTDLGSEWKAHTGLPFVWAFWAGRPAALEPEVCEVFARARNDGVRNVAAIAAAYGAGDPERTRRAERYLRHNIQCHLSEAHEAALERFCRSAVRLGVVPAWVEPRWAARVGQDVAL
jgi:chorismate dehydratase